MEPRFINDKWYIEVDTEELGKVLLLKPGSLPIAIDFESEDAALKHIESKRASNDKLLKGQ